MKTFITLLSVFACFVVIGCLPTKDIPEQLTNTEPKKDITITLPEIDLSAYPELESGLSDFATQMEASFTKMYEATENDPEDIVDWALDIETEILRDDDLVISLLSQTYMYTGGAHGNVFYHSWNYHKPSQKLLRLEDVLLDTDITLRALSGLAVEELTSREISDPDWISDGAGPEVQNFSIWTFTIENEIRFTFDPYQVAAYAVGPVDILFPAETMKEFIRPEYLPAIGIESTET